jgi:hypothetical protein
MIFKIRTVQTNSRHSTVTVFVGEDPHQTFSNCGTLTMSTEEAQEFNELFGMGLKFTKLRHAVKEFLNDDSGIRYIEKLHEALGEEGK